MTNAHMPFNRSVSAVDLAVEHDAEPPVRRPHGLLPACEVEDRQPPMPEMNARGRIAPQALAIGPPVDQRIGHALQIIKRPAANESCNAAHYWALPTAKWTIVLANAGTQTVGFIAVVLANAGTQRPSNQRRLAASAARSHSRAFSIFLVSPTRYTALPCAS